MVENISQIRPEQMPEGPGKPSFMDIHTLHKTLSDIGTLQQALMAAKRIEKTETRSKESTDEAEETHEDEGLAGHKKKKKKKATGTKTTRQKKMEHLASLHAVEDVDSEGGVPDDGGGAPLGDDEGGAPLGGIDPNQLPPGLQAAYEEQMKDMQQFFNLILQGGDPKYAKLVQLWKQQLGQMHQPPTAADATQLNMIMQLMQSAVASLPPGVQTSFYTLEIQMYTDMKNLANSDIHSLTPQIAHLKDEINMLQKLVPLLQAGEAAAEALASGNPTYSDFVQMGQNIIALEELLGDLPANSPMRGEVQKALAAWGSLASSNPSFPPGMILGYSLFLAEMQNYASKGGTKQGIGQVWDFFNHFNTDGIPGLANAIAFIHKEFPSTSMNPTDWSYTKDGHIQMNYNGFNALLKQGLGKAISNMAAIENALESEYSTLNNQLTSDQSQLQNLQSEFNEVSHDLGLFIQFLSQALSHVSQPPGGGNYIQKALLALVQQEIEGFLMLISILEKYIPGAKLNGFRNEVNAIADHMPNITVGDLNSLNGILGQLNQYAGKIPYKSFKASYWGAELDLFNTISKIGAATGDNNGIIYRAIQDMMSIIKRMEGGSFTEADLQNLVNDIETLMKNGKVLSYGDTNAIAGFLESLSNVMGSDFGNAKGPQANLYNIIVLSIQFGLIQDYSKQAGSGATESGLQQYIDNFVGHLPNSGNSFLAGMESDLENLSNCIGPGALFELASVGPGGKLNFDSTSLAAMSSAFLAGGLHPVGGDPGGWMLLINELNDLLDSFDPKKNGLSWLAQYLAQIDRAIDVCWAMLWDVDSLQDLFRRVLIDQFLPEQEQMLKEYSRSLQFNNDAGNMLNQLLKILTDLTQAKSNYAGAPKNAADKKKMEKNIQKDTAEITKALAQIQADLALVNRTDYGDDPDVLAGKKKLIKQLNDMAGNLQVAQQQLAKVASDLQTGKGDITKDLNTLVNGDATVQPPNYAGGLSKIIDDANGASQDYSSVSLTKEYMMQLIMSRVEQEIEIISSSMKSIHDAYMTFAQAIYK